MKPRTGKIVSAVVAAFAVVMTALEIGFGQYLCAAVSLGLLVSSGLSYLCWDKYQKMQQVLDQRRPLY